MTNKRTSMTHEEIREAAETAVGRLAKYQTVDTLLLARACLDLLETIEKLRRVHENLERVR